MTGPSAIGRGRPLDPDFENRVYAATLTLYGEVGWAGFSLDAVARRARVGKGGLYQRWNGKEALIAAALMECSRSFPATRNTGSVRDDLIDMAVGMLHFYISGYGLVMHRAHMEARVYPDVFGSALLPWKKWSRQTGRTIVLQAKLRGELPADTSPAFVLDMVAGTLINHFLSTPSNKMAALETDAASYAARVVDFVLEGLGYRGVVSNLS